MYPDTQVAVKSDDTAARELSGFTDRHQNLLGRYYDRIRLIPFTPDPYSVYLSEPSELVRTQGLKVFDRMLLDDMIASSVVGWISQILTDARFQPAGDSKECKDVADCLNSSTGALPGGLVACLFDVLFGAVYGFSVSTRPVQFIQAGQWRGHVGLKAIRYLEPHFLEPVFEGEHGDLVGWNQVDRSLGSTFFAEDEVIHFVHNRRRDPARGQSLILPAHPHWIAKTLLLQMRNYVAEWTIGKLVLEHDPSVKDAITKTEFYTRANDLIANYLMRSGFAMPAGIKATLMSGNAEVSPDVFDSALKFCNQGILRTCSGNWTLSEEPETGSRALAETQSSVAGARFKVPREDFRSLIQRKVGDYLGKLNGWRPEHWAKFTLSPPIEDDRQARVTAYLAAVTAQAISVQPADENWLRESFGAPLVKETGGLVDTPQAPGAQAEAQPPTEAPLSLNGAQIDSARTIIADVASGALPSSTAHAMLTGMLAVNAMVSDNILAPFRQGFKPASPMAGVPAPEAAEPEVKPAGEAPPEKFSELREVTYFTDGSAWMHASEDQEDFGWQEQPRVPAGGKGGGQFGGHGWVRATSLESKAGHWIKPGEGSAHIRPIGEHPKYEAPKKELRHPKDEHKAVLDSADPKFKSAIVRASNLVDKETAEDGDVLKAHTIVGKAQDEVDRSNLSAKDRMALHDVADSTRRYINSKHAGILARAADRRAKALNEATKAERANRGKGNDFDRHLRIYQHSEQGLGSSKPAWWDRPKTAGEMRCNFAQIDTGLQGIIDRGRDKMEAEWGKALEAFSRRVTGWAESERVTPAQLLANINETTLDLDGYEQALLNVSKQAWLFGAEHAAKELEASGAPSVKRPAALKFAEAKVAPDNPHSLGNFTALSKSRSFRVRKDKERQALSAIAVTLESAFNAGLTVPEAKVKLRDVYSGLASGKMIAPGTPGHDYTKDAVQETTVRTMATSAFGAARLDLYTRNDDWCLGTERSEVLGGRDGERSHPLSKHVDGLKVRFSDPRYKQLSGCLAFNDRGVDIPLTQMDEPIEWSTDAEIEEALAWKAELSPGF